MSNPKRMIKIKCEQCDEEFEYFGFRHYTRRYCSPECIFESRHGFRPNSKQKYTDKDGYVKIKVKGKYVHEHRHKMEKKLKRKLRKGESVHHKNGRRADNRMGNLELWASVHPYGQRVSEIVCPHCGKAYA